MSTDDVVACHVVCESCTVGNVCSAFFTHSLLPQPRKSYNRFPTTTMTEAWKEGQLQSLAIAYEVRQRELDSFLDLVEFPAPASSHIALLRIYTDVLDGTDTPPAAAKRLNEWVVSAPDNDTTHDISYAYHEVLRMLFTGARELSSQKHLKILADLTVELANLPNVYNTTDTPMEFEGGDIVVQPGERIKLPCLTRRELWSSLPDFVGYMRGDLYGPSLGCNVVTGIGHADEQRRLHREGEDKYTNVNTYAALIAQQRPPKESPLSCCVDNAFAVFAYIEHGQDTNYGRHAHLVVRAVAAWLTIAGEELVAAGSPTRKYSYSPGSSWEPEGGGNTVNVKRLQFWKDAVQQLRESRRLSSQEAVNATVDAAAAIDRLIAVQG